MNEIQKSELENVKSEIAGKMRAKGLRLAVQHLNTSQSEILLGLEYFHVGLPESIFYLVTIQPDGAKSSFSDFGRRRNSVTWQPGIHPMHVNNRYGVQE